MVKKVFAELTGKLDFYDQIKASDLNKALRNNETLMYAEEPNEGKMAGSHFISNVFKDLGFDGIVMDAKSAFPNMKNIDEGTLHAVPLKKNTVKSALTDKTLFADSSKEGSALQANKPAFYSALERGINTLPNETLTGEQWLSKIWEPETVKKVGIRDEKNKVIKDENGQPKTKDVVVQGKSSLPGVKPEEMQWTGLKDFLEENKGKPVTKEQINEHLANNKVELKEVNKGAIQDPIVKYLKDDYQTTKEIRNSEDIANAKKYNAHFKETVKGLSDDEILKAARQAEQVKDIQDTKYHSYQLPGGENYREMLLTLPS